MILKKERFISDPVVTTVAVLANEPRAAVGSNDFFFSSKQNLDVTRPFRREQRSQGTLTTIRCVTSFLDEAL